MQQTSDSNLSGNLPEQILKQHHDLLEPSWVIMMGHSLGQLSGFCSMQYYGDPKGVLS